MVSVVIPSYQKGKFIKDALVSVASQSFANWECIVVDNGSFDETRPILESWSRRDSRVKWLDASSCPKNGSACRNLGLAASAGEFVLFLDADDLLADHCLGRRIGFAEDNKGRDFFVFAVKTFKQSPNDRSGKLWKPESKHPLSRLLFHRISWHTSGSLWRRSYLHGIGGFDEAYSRFQDIETHIRGLLHSKEGFVVSGCSIPDAFYRSDEARSHQSNRAILDDYVESGIRMLRVIPKHLAECGRGRCSGWLSGTGLVLLQRLRSGLENGWISSNQADDLARDVILEGRTHCSWDLATVLLLRSYWTFWSRMALRVRGVNFAFRTTLSMRATARSGL